MPRKSGLSVVQSLYETQFQLLELLDSDLSQAENCTQAKKCLKEFASLLKEADWQYMGGEDVFEALQSIEKTAGESLKSLSARRKGSLGTKSTKATAAKKKPAAKKVQARKTPKRAPSAKKVASKKAVPQKKTVSSVRARVQKKKATRKKK